MPLFSTQPTLGTTAPATATGTITTTSTTDVLATSMTLTPAAGTYLVFFRGAAWNTSTGAGLGVFLSIYAGGSQDAGSQLFLSDGTNFNTPFTCVAVVTVNGAQAIEGRWRIAAGSGTASMLSTRALTIVQIG